ncbi:hypothetical protein BJ878DRAFT_476556 [Calycina marina]|uniref:Disease resistance R13L4/SHOC-2-like LRR domain-containing protein n=1 Tax=Calycina marina TaxID=1763456 RepID=A0A9P8CJ10_9HELO|nr:hypothetical protein BJ878DRAFT_476556 [Calycina marina]
MDQGNTSGPSALPRRSQISKLPVPRSLRPSPSRETLQQPPSRNTTALPRLRATPSREQLSNSASAKYAATSKSIPARNRLPPVSSQPTQTLRTPNSNALLRKPSRPVVRAALPPRSDSSDEAILEGSGDEPDYPILSRKERPSLSERTMETLQRIPSTPAKRRTSNFFNTESPMQAPSQSSRSGSNHQSDASTSFPFRSFSSRPSSSSGNDNGADVDFRASTNTFRPSRSSVPAATPLKRPGPVRVLKTPIFVRNSIIPLETINSGPNQEKVTAPLPTTKSGSRTLSSRQLKPRASVNGLFRKPSMPSLDQSVGDGNKEFELGKPNTRKASQVRKATVHTTSSGYANDSEVPSFKKTSSSLRDQIAAAKAAKRAAAAKKPSRISPSNEDHIPVMAAGTFDSGPADDPFNLQFVSNGGKGLLKSRIATARGDGRLNIAAMGLKVIPNEVMTMYDSESGGSWAETVDLTRFVAADNEFELLGDDVFPDIDAREVTEDEDFKGNQFGGLENLDLHGNVLTALPFGLRRLELLTTLNLSNNKLGNGSFEVISQVISLRDLNLAGNVLAGVLPESLAKLINLETLDVQRNAITELPSVVRRLSRLKVLNLTENRLMSLPFEGLQHLPLIQLMAPRNNLSGTLIDDTVVELPRLQVLDITANSLTSISTSERLLLSSLHQLVCSSNRLKDLPEMSSWDSLLTLTAEDNQLSVIPSGFVRLKKLKTANFSNNNIKNIDNEIGAMDNLDIFRISGNPLREKNFSSMSTESLKNALKLRLEPVEQATDPMSDDGFYSAQESPVAPRSPSWPVKPGGVLDRSNTESASLNPVKAAEAAASNVVRTLELHHNNFKVIPSSIAFFAASLTTLSLAHNELRASDYLCEELELPLLRELDLSSNTLNDLQPLIQRLKAPNLERIDISFNRLTSLPPLIIHFPKLRSVIASNNSIKELTPESVKGLRVLDVNTNDMGTLNPRIGLFGGAGGLEKLDVRCNRFRVPNYALLEKGTEATLAWLRNRLPASETSSDMSPADVHGV